MKQIVIFGLMLLLSNSTFLYAQTNHEEILPPAEKPMEIKKSDPYVSVEHMPVFPGGEDALFKYLSDNIVYPAEAKKQGIKGIVYVYFVIDELGNVINAEVKRGVKGGEMLDNEALRVIKSMPNWNPGSQNGKPASVQFTLPIKFTLQTDSEKK